MSRRLPHPGSPQAARRRAPRGQGSLLRAEILDAAERLLIETGNEDAVSIRAIAKQVGVSPPSIYLHFPDKETLLFAVCHQQFEEFHDYLETAAREVDDPVEAIVARSEAYVRFGIERPEAYRIMFMGRGTTEDRHLATLEQSGFGSLGHVVASVQRAIDAGRLRDDLDATESAIFLWTAMHGITSLLISLPSFPWGDRDALVHRLCALQLCALEQEHQ